MNPFERFNEKNYFPKFLLTIHLVKNTSVMTKTNIFCL